MDPESILVSVIPTMLVVLESVNILDNFLAMWVVLDEVSIPVDSTAIPVVRFKYSW